MGKHSKNYSYKPLSRIDGALFTYEQNKKNETVHRTVCDYCGEPFEFTKKDVKDRTIKCPHCKADMVFFAYDYL